MTTLNEMVKNISERHRKAATDEIKQIEQCYLVVQLLAGAGVKTPAISQYDGVGFFHISVQKEDLIKVRHALGKMNLAGKGLADPRKRLLDVRLSPQDFPFVRIEYTTKLPRARKGPDGQVIRPKCRIRRVRTSYSTLVCE